MAKIRTRLTLAALCVALAALPALGSERVERTLDLTQPIPKGGKLRVENLLGSLVVRGDRTGGRVVVRARVVAEADTWAEANEIAESIELSPSKSANTTTIEVAYPVERFSAFKLPRSEKSGLLAKWVTPLISKSTVAAQYGGRNVEVGSGRGAAALAVHVEIEVPLEIEASLRQTVGTVQATAVRGKFELEVVEGRIVAEQVYGSLSTRTGGGDVIVRKFTGDGIELQTASGRLDVFEVQAERTRVRTGSGSLEASAIRTSDFRVESSTGVVRVDDLDAVALDVLSGSGEVDLDLRITRTREAQVRTDTGDVVLRVNPTTPFALHAESAGGSVQHKDVAAEVLDMDKNRMHLQRGKGGADLRVTSTKGDVTVRPG